jgi:hypothetical protein
VEICLEHLKKLFDDFSIRKSPFEEGDDGEVSNIGNDTKTNKLLEGTPVINNEFEILIA